MENLSKYAETTTLNSLETGNSGIGFLTSGVSYHYIKEMFPDASVLKLGFTYPFCDSKIREFSRDLKELYIVEELDPFIEEHVKTWNTLKQKRTVTESVNCSLRIFPHS